MMLSALLVLAPLFPPSQEQTSAFRTVEFPSLDGLTITADLYAPHEDPKTPFLVLCHQAGWSRGEYRETAPRFVAMGFNCLAIDQRSGGEVREVPNETAKAADEKGLGTNYLDARQDIIAAVRHARSKYAEGPLVLVGSSYSAALVLEIAGSEPGLADVVLSFSPGEYFQRLGKGPAFIQKAAAHIECPVFVTSAKEESGAWKGIFEAIPGEKKVSYTPETAGNHGSRALWKRFEDCPGYWNAVTSFLDTFVPRECEATSGERGQ